MDVVGRGLEIPLRLLRREPGLVCRRHRVTDLLIIGRCLISGRVKNFLRSCHQLRRLPVIWQPQVPMRRLLDPIIEMGFVQSPLSIRQAPDRIGVYFIRQSCLVSAR